MDNLSILTNETYNDSHRENKKMRLRQQLVDLSCYYLLDIGYEKLSLEKIAEEANVSVRTILRYFDSKAGLVTAPCKNNLELFRADIQGTNRALPTFETWQHHISKRLLGSGNTKLFLDYVLSVHREPALASMLEKHDLEYQQTLANGFARDEHRKVTLADKLFAGALLSSHTTVIRHWIELGKDSGLTDACLNAAQDTYERYKISLQ